MEKLSIPIPHSNPSRISLASSLRCFKDTISPSALSSSSRITRAFAFRTIVPSLTLDPAIKPIFGICLGHQILALAIGAKTFKLKFGHRGCNHPVKNLQTNIIEITSQNHGFAVSDKGLPKDATITHKNLNDGTIEGIECADLKAFSVQHHPESSPGPHDSRYLFHNFIKLMETEKIHA